MFLLEWPAEAQLPQGCQTALPVNPASSPASYNNHQETRLDSHDLTQTSTTLQLPSYMPPRPRYLPQFVIMCFFISLLD